MPKVTEKLRQEWQWSLIQNAEERTHDQQGRVRSQGDLAIHDRDAAVLRALLELPLGTKFDARDVYHKLFGE